MDPSTSTSPLSISKSSLRSSDATASSSVRGLLVFPSNKTSIVTLMEEIDADINVTLTVVQHQSHKSISTDLAKISKLFIDFRQRFHERSFESVRLLADLISFCHLCNPIAKDRAPMTKERLTKALGKMKAVLEEEKKRNEIEEVVPQRRGKYIEYRQNRIPHEGDLDRLVWLDSISTLNLDLTNEDQITTIVKGLKFIHKSLSENQRYRLLGLFIPICELHLLPVNHNDAFFAQKLHDCLTIMYEGVLTLIKFNKQDEEFKEKKVVEFSSAPSKRFVNYHSLLLSSSMADFFQSDELTHLETIASEIKSLQSRVFKIASKSTVTTHIKTIITRLQELQQYEATIAKVQSETRGLIPKLENLLNEGVKKNPDYLKRVQDVLMEASDFLTELKDNQKILFKGIDTNPHNTNFTYYYITAHTLTLVSNPFFSLMLYDWEQGKREAEKASAADQSPPLVSTDTFDLAKLPGFAQLSYHNIASVFDFLEKRTTPKVREINEGIQLAIAADWIGDSDLLEQCEDKLFDIIRVLPDKYLENYVQLLADDQIVRILPRFHEALFKRVLAFITPSQQNQVAIISKYPTLLRLFTLDFSSIDQYFTNMWYYSKYYRDQFTGQLAPFFQAQVGMISEMNPDEINCFLTNLTRYEGFDLNFQCLYHQVALPAFHKHLLDLMQRANFNFLAQLTPLHQLELTKASNSNASSSSSSHAAPSRKKKRKDIVKESDFTSAQLLDPEVPLDYITANWTHVQVVITDDTLKQFLHSAAHFIKALAKQIEIEEQEPTYLIVHRQANILQKRADLLLEALKLLADAEELEKAIYCLDAKMALAKDPQPLQAEIDDKKRALDLLFKDFSAIGTKLHAIGTKLQSQASTNSTASDSIQRRAIYNQIRDLKTQHPKAKNITAELKFLKNELTILEAKITSLKSKRGTHSLESSETQEKHTALDDKIAELQSQQRFLETESAKLERIKEDIESSSRYLIYHENTPLALSDRLAQLPFILKALAQAEQMKTGSQQKVLYLEKQKASFQKAIADIKKGATLDKHNKQKTDRPIGLQLESNQKSITDIDNAIAALQKLISKSLIDVAYWKIELNDILQQSLLEIEKERRTINAEIAKQEAKISRLKKRHTDLVAQTQNIPFDSILQQPSTSTSKQNSDSTKSRATKSSSSAASSQVAAPSPNRQAAMQNHIKLASLQIFWKNTGDQNCSLVFLILNQQGEISNVASRITSLTQIHQPCLALQINQIGTFSIANQADINKLDSQVQQIVAETVMLMNEYCKSILKEIRQAKRGRHPVLQASDIQYDGIELNALDVAVTIFWGATTLEQSLNLLIALGDMYDNLAPISRSTPRSNASAASSAASASSGD